MPEDIPHIKTDPNSPHARAEFESRSETNRQLAELNKTLALILTKLTETEMAIRSITTTIAARPR